MYYIGVVGFDFSGRIVALGSDVQDYTVGDKVYGRSQGAYGHYVNAQISTISKFQHLTYHDAAAYPIAYLSAYESLYVVANIKSRSGQTIFIPGGTGGVGHFAVQLALHEGLNVITSTSKSDSIQYLQKIGVQHIINYKQHDVVQEVLKLTNGQGADIVYDPTYLPSSFIQSASVVASGGIWLRLGPLADADKVIDIVKQRGGTPTFGDLGRYGRDPAYISKQALLHDALVLADQLYHDGTVRPLVSKVYELHEINEALDAVRKGQLPGKAVIKIK